MADGVSYIEIAGLVAFSIAMFTGLWFFIHEDSKQIFCSTNFEKTQIEFYQCEEMYDGGKLRSEILRELKENINE